MRRHTRSGATIVVALSLVAIGCGEKAPSAPIIGSNGAGSSQIALTRRADTVAVDESIQLSAIIPSAPGTVVPTVSWSSSDPSVAIVTQNGVLFALKSGRTTVSVTARGYSDATTVTVKPSVRDVSFDSDSLAISVSQSVKLPYRVTDSDGNQVDLSTHQVQWITSDPTVVPLTGDAVVTGRTIGAADLMLRVDNREATTRVKVLSKPVATVVASPTSLKIGVTQNATLTITAYDVQGNVLTGRSLTWSSSDQTIAYVSTSGVVTGVANGQATITVTVDGRKSTTVPVTVGAGPTNPTVAVASVAVSLNASSLIVGQTTQANATTKDANGNVLTGRTIVWTTSDPAVASVDGGGVLSALKAGTVTVTATSEGKTGSAPFAVTASPTAPVPVASMTLTVSPTLNVGQSVQAVVTLKDASGNVLTGRTVNWVSSDATIVSVSASGVVTALKGGGVTISASADGVSASAVVSAVAPKAAVSSIALSAGTTQIKIGQLTQVTAVVRDASGNIISGVPVTFSASPSTIATVSGSGMVAGVNVGSAAVYAKADTVTRSIGLAVIDTVTAPAPSPSPSTPPPAGIAILPGESIQAKVDANPAGTAFVLKAGTHVQQQVSPKAGDSFTGEPGAVMDGQNVTQFAFQGKTSTGWVNNVTLRNIKITRYNPPAQNGAVWGGNDQANGTSGWTLDSMEISYNTNLGVRIGNRMRVLNSKLHHNTTINIGGIGVGVVVDNVEIAYGNDGCPNDPGFESGGSKFVRTDSLIVRNSFIHHSCGVGLWLDIANANYQLYNNRIEDNIREGIAVEISGGGKIYNNSVLRNGNATDPWRTQNWLWDAGISAQASTGVEIYKNTVSGNFNGIVGIQQARGGSNDPPGATYVLQDLYVHDNTITQNIPQGAGLANAAAGIVEDNGDATVFSGRNNRYQNNTYYLLPPGAGNSPGFEWMGWKTDSQWKGYGMDVAGQFNH